MPQPHGSDIMEHRVLLGGYSSEVPPLPIPNREVKLTNADGTAYLGGRVGSRLFKRRMMKIVLLFLFYLSFYHALLMWHLGCTRSTIPSATFRYIAL